MTRTKDEALHRAQSAIDYTILALSNGNDLTYAKACLESALTAIKQALAAPVQEPVGYVAENGVVDWNVCAPPILTDLYTTPPAQPAPVQEPFGYLEIDDIESQREYPNNCRNVNLWHEGGEGMVAIYTTPPAAQRQCTWPTCQSEEYQQALAEQINQELVTGAAQPAPDYAWPTVADYEKDVGFEVNEAFKMAWAMARTTNALFT